MYQRLHARNARILPYDSLTWGDISRVESPVLAHRFLKTAHLELRTIAFPMCIDIPLHGMHVLTHLERGNEHSPVWQTLLDQVLQGRLYLVVDEPTAPAVRWRNDPSQPSGGHWEPQSNLYARASSNDLFWLFHQIQILTITRKGNKQPPSAEPPSPALRPKENSSDEEFDAYVQLTSGDKPLRLIPVRITASNGRVTDTTTDEFGFLRLPPGLDDQAYSLQILRDRKMA